MCFVKHFIFSFVHEVCVKTANACCYGEDEYGPSCIKCPKGKNNEVCSGRGKAEGAGDRKGKGTCKCDYNYKGKLCDECKNKDFFLKTQASETEKPECVRCNTACKVFTLLYRLYNIVFYIIQLI